MLPELHRNCQTEIRRYKKNISLSVDSPSCAEIARRAAAGDLDAQTMLFALSASHIEKRCPPDLKAQREDLKQEVFARLLKRFQDKKIPFQVTTFAAYLRYLFLTIRSVSRNMRRQKSKRTVSLEAFQQETGFEPDVSSPEDRVEKQLLLERCLQAIPDALAKEAFRRRYVLGESPGHIALALQEQSPGINKERVYRLCERALRRAAKILQEDARKMGG